MKYLPLVWAGIWRKKSRAILMLLQIVSAFLLFGLLQGLNSGIKQAIAKTHSDRLYVSSSVSITDGPYLEAKEHIGGFWILECADMDEALAWGRKAVVACRVPVEVRAFHRIRPDRK